MRWDSPIVLVAAGTLAIHTILLVFVDAMIVTHPIEIKKPAPKLEMFEVKVEPPPKPKLDLPKAQARLEPPKTAPQPRVQPRLRTPEPPKQDTPPPPPSQTPPSADSGGGPVLNMENLAPDARGTVPVVAGGKQVTRPGRGGTGTGTGAGSGSGASSAPPPPPVSVATIKTRALPKGDYG